MGVSEQIIVTNIPEISAIYFSLLQCGYDFYKIEREPEQVAKVENFLESDSETNFFSKVKQDTCEVYPYWPRAALLEKAAFFLDSEQQEFLSFAVLEKSIMSMGNISDEERNQDFWEWIKDFPCSLHKILGNNSFKEYFEWEKEWIRQQNLVYKNELSDIQKILDSCLMRYQSPVKKITVVLNPIKCVYSADYYLVGEDFVFCSGRFDKESIIHEVLHHIIHPVVEVHREEILQKETAYPGIDSSYYLSHDDAGKLNAFEEYFVRELTRMVCMQDFPEDLNIFLRAIL